MNQRIHRQMAIDDIFQEFPQKISQLAAELSMAGLDCCGLSASKTETLEEGMALHGMNDDQINTLVDQLNEILCEPDDVLSISMSKPAADQFRSILAEENKTGWALRFGVQSSGCCAFEYFLDYSSEAQPTDAVFESHGIQIHVDQKSIPQLLGCVIDYAEGKPGAGFKIINPSSGCGCSSNSQGCCSS